MGSSVFTAAYGTFSCSFQTLGCGTWDLVPLTRDWTRAPCVHAVIFSLLSSVFRWLRRCVSRCKLYGKGSQVPACSGGEQRVAIEFWLWANDITGPAPGPASPVASALSGLCSWWRLPRWPGLRAPHSALALSPSLCVQLLPLHPF